MVKWLHQHTFYPSYSQNITAQGWSVCTPNTSLKPGGGGIFCVLVSLLVTGIIRPNKSNLRRVHFGSQFPVHHVGGSQGRRNLTQLVASYPPSGSRGACLCSALILLPESRIPSQGTVTSKVGESSHLGQPKKW